MFPATCVNLFASVTSLIGLYFREDDKGSLENITNQGENGGKIIMWLSKKKSCVNGLM